MIDFALCLNALVSYFRRFDNDIELETYGHPALLANKEAPSLSQESMYVSIVSTRACTRDIYIFTVTMSVLLFEPLLSTANPSRVSLCFSPSDFSGLTIGRELSFAQSPV